jgi:hypothetical protein
MGPSLENAVLNVGTDREAAVFGAATHFNPEFADRRSAFTFS